VAIISLLIVVLNTQFLGAEGVGEISLFVLGISLSTSVSEFYGGANITYLASRENSNAVFLPSYFISTLVGVLFSFAYFVFDYFTLVECSIFFICCTLQGCVNVHYHWLSGRSKVHVYNYALFLFYISILALCGLAYWKLKLTSVSSYYISYLIGLVLTLLLTSYSIQSSKGFKDLRSFRFKYSILKLGVQNQTCVLAQMLNYRLIYFVIEFLLGKATLGLFSVANQIVEGAWIPSKAIATVQYSELSNLDDKKEEKKLSLKYSAISLISTALILFVALLLPDWFYGQLFGEDFKETGSLILLLTHGALALALSRNIGAYFSGNGNHKINMYASLIGLLLNVSFVYFLIDRFELLGAGILTAIVFWSLTIYQAVQFSRN